VASFDVATIRRLTFLGGCVCAVLGTDAVARGQGLERLPPVNGGSSLRAVEMPPSALPAWEAPVDARPVGGAPIGVGPAEGAIRATPVYAEQIVPGEPIADDALYHDYITGETASGCVKRIPDFKSGFFQKLRFTGTWIPSFDETDVGFSDLEALLTVAAPLPTAEWPLFITPKFMVRYLDGPSTPDLPARLYDTGVEFRWLPKVSERLRLALAIEPSLHTDFETNDADAFRTPGHAVAIYDWTPTRQFVIGAMYLDREDIDILPAGGLILKPSEDWQFDLLFPFPKIASRLWADGRTEYWHYVAAEFGSGPYSIRREDGRQDVIILSDYRLLYGLEKKKLGGLWSRIEAGYVFGREIEFVSNDPRYQPSPTLLLRAGVQY
jgi:hypothetical protein